MHPLHDRVGRYLEDDDALLGLASARGGPAVLVAVTTQHLTGSWTGWAAAVRRERTGLLLDPSCPQDGEPFGVRAPPPDERTPGRGLLVVRGTAVPVQVALPP